MRSAETLTSAYDDAFVGRLMSAEVTIFEKQTYDVWESTRQSKTDHLTGPLTFAFLKSSGSFREKGTRFHFSEHAFNFPNASEFQLHFLGRK